MRTIILGMLACLLSGCAGFVAWGPGTIRYESPDYGITNWSHGLVQQAGHGDGRPLDRQRVIRSWGEPESKARNPDGSETWVYPDEWRWLGVIPVVVIPLPIVVPVGEARWELRIKDGVVISAEHKTTKGIGGYCGLAVRRGISGDSAKRPGCESA